MLMLLPWRRIQVRSASRCRVRAATVSFLRRRTVWSTPVPLLWFTLPLADVFADGARSVPPLPDVVDRVRSDRDGLPPVARRRRAVPDIGRLRTSTSARTGRRWRLVCPPRGRSAVAAVRETRNIHLHRCLRRRTRYGSPWKEYFAL